MKTKYTKRHGVIVVSLAVMMAFMMSPDVNAQNARSGRGKTTTVSKERGKVSRSGSKRSTVKRERVDKKSSVKRERVDRKTTVKKRNDRGDRVVKRNKTTRTVTRDNHGGRSRTTVRRDATRERVDRVGKTATKRRTGSAVRSGSRTSNRGGTRTVTRDRQNVRSDRGRAYDSRSKRRVTRDRIRQYRPKYNYRHLDSYSRCNVRHRPGHFHYRRSHVHVSSHITLGITWPWVHKRHRHWSPRYRYRQVVYVNAGYGRRYRRANVDVRTYYRHRVRHATHDYAEIDIEVDEIEIFRSGRFYGKVDRIPGKLRKIRATVWSDGRVEFDRNVFLLGDTESGFEMLSTRYYDDYLLNSYRNGHGMRVGELDLYDERVRSRKRSRLFRYQDFNGHVPISLLPDDDRLFDYGFGSEYSDYYNDSDYGGYVRRDERSYSGPGGAAIQFQRETQVERLDD